MPLQENLPLQPGNWGSVNQHLANFSRRTAATRIVDDPAAIMAEAFPRWGAPSNGSATVGLPQAVRITLAAGAYTSVTVNVVTAAVGANGTAYLALYNTSDGSIVGGASNYADISTPVKTAGVVAATLNNTIATPGDYWLVYLQGVAYVTTQPALSAAALSGQPALLALPPAVSARSNTAGLTTPPSTFTPESPAVQSHFVFWARYQ